jgi:hypothetical protein
LIGYIVKTAALGGARAVFNFNKENCPILLGYQVNLADFGLPIAIDNFKTLLS